MKNKKRQSLYKTIVRLENDITAVILAAGQGKRLRPITEHTPKCLVNIDTRPILYHQLTALEKNNIKDVIVVTGYRSEMISEYVLKNFPQLNVVFVYNPKYKTTNNLYSLALAAEHLKNPSTILQLNCDVIFDPLIISRIKNTSATRSYSVAIIGRCSDEEIKIELADNGSIRALNKKIDPSVAIGEAVGIHKYSYEFWKLLSKNLQAMKYSRALEYYELAVENTIAMGARLYPFDIKNLFAMEIDFESDLVKARETFPKFI